MCKDKCRCLIPTGGDRFVCRINRVVTYRDVTICLFEGRTILSLILETFQVVRKLNVPVDFKIPTNLKFDNVAQFVPLEEFGSKSGV